MTAAAPTPTPALGEPPHRLSAVLPCAPERRPAYEAEIARGRALMAETRAVVCGIVRDAGPRLSRTLGWVEALGASFREHRVIWVENDSRDDTAERLRAWARGRPDVEILSERLGIGPWPQRASGARASALASQRNRYLARVRAAAADFDHVVVLDADLLDLCLDGVAHGFGQDGWDVLGSWGIRYGREANGALVPWLYDTWAHRDLGHPEPHGHGWLKRRRYLRGGPLERVLSCFGGLALYRMEALRSGARYDGPDCEHVTLHRRLAAAGFDRIFVNPSQLVLHGP